MKLLSAFLVGMSLMTVSLSAGCPSCSNGKCSMEAVSTPSCANGQCSFRAPSNGCSSCANGQCSFQPQVNSCANGQCSFQSLMGGCANGKCAAPTKNVYGKAKRTLWLILFSRT